MSGQIDNRMVSYISNLHTHMCVYAYVYNAPYTPNVTLSSLSGSCSF